jgi:hypothetical protein
MPGSTELKIPAKISRRFNFKYKPIFLNADFENEYSYHAKQAVIWSDGRGTIRRANHTYSYSILSKHSRFVITGLMGSELIRPTNAVDHIFNKEFVDTFYSDNQLQEIKNQYEKFVRKGILKDDLLNSSKKLFIKETTNYFASFNLLGEKYKQLYYFALSEGFKKYFGHEIHGSRIFNFIQTPYIDDDFVDFLLMTPVPLLNKNAFERNPKTLRLGQLFYIPILKSNFPALLEIRTGRFYKPSALTSFLYPVSVFPALILKKLNQMFKKNDTFNTSRWNKVFMEENSSLTSLDTNIFNPLTTKIITSNRDIDISKFISIRFWLEEVYKDKNEE